VRGTASTHDEVCGLDVAVNERAGVDEFDTGYLGTNRG
jgi:hypothetical protein